MASQAQAGAVSPLSGDVQPAAGASTSEQRCPVCLEDFEDKAFVDSCFHILLYQKCQIYIWANRQGNSLSVLKQMLFRYLHLVVD